MATPTSTVAEGVLVAGTAVVASVVRGDSSSATTPATVSTTPVVTPAISGPAASVSSSSTAGKFFYAGFSLCFGVSDTEGRHFDLNFIGCVSGCVNYFLGMWCESWCAT